MPIEQPNGPVTFPPRNVLQRDWGKEVILIANEHWTLKLIWMRGHTEGGLQYHHKKFEGGYVTHGDGYVEYDVGAGKLSLRYIGAEDCFYIPQGAAHRIKAGPKGLRYVEASTPHLNDRAHCEADYGQTTETGGLPSTHPDDVVHIAQTTDVAAYLGTDPQDDEIFGSDPGASGKQENTAQERKAFGRYTPHWPHNTISAAEQAIDRLSRINRLS